MRIKMYVMCHNLHSHNVIMMQPEEKFQYAEVTPLARVLMLSLSRACLLWYYHKAEGFYQNVQ